MNKIEIRLTGDSQFTRQMSQGLINYKNGSILNEQSALRYKYFFNWIFSWRPWPRKFDRSERKREDKQDKRLYQQSKF